MTTLVLFGVAGTGAAAFAFYHAFTSFVFYDDEGFSLLWLRLFLDGHALYDDMFTTFGPAYFAWHWVLFRAAGVAVGHDAVRLITIAHWLTAAGLFAGVAWRIGGSRVVAAAVFLQTVWHLFVLRNEPGHAQGMTLVLMGLILLAGTGLATRTGRAGLLALAGTFGAALLLTKVNVGLFSVAPLALTCLLFMPAGTISRVLAGACALLLLAMPALLMREHLAASDVTRNYGLAATGGIGAAVLAVWSRKRTTRIAFGDAAAGAAGAVLACGVIAGFVLLRGTTPAGLVTGVVLRPLEMPGAYFREAAVSPLPALASWMSLTIAALLLVRRTGRARAGARILLTALKLLAPVLIWSLSLDFQNVHMLLSWGPAFVWLLVARAEPNRPVSPGRTLLAVTAATQTLTAYPSPGTQAWLATALFIPTFGIVFADGLRETAMGLRATRARFRRLRRRPTLSTVTSLVAMVLVIVAYGAWADLPRLRAGYQAMTPLDLPGTRMLRLPANTVAHVHWATQNLRAYGDRIVTLPGLLSFYFWHPSEPPTADMVSNWMLLLREEEEEAIVDVLGRERRVAGVMSPPALVFWTRDDTSYMERPLVQYINSALVPLAMRGNYWLLVEPEFARPPVREALQFEERTFGRNAGSARPLPVSLFRAGDGFTLSATFRTRGPGVMLELGGPGFQAAAVAVDAEGRLRAGLPPGAPARSEARVDDGNWHTVELVVLPDGQEVYLDGDHLGSLQPAHGLAETVRAWLGGRSGVRFEGTMREVWYTHAAADAQSPSQTP